MNFCYVSVFQSTLEIVSHLFELNRHVLQLTSTLDVRSLLSDQLQTRNYNDDVTTSLRQHETCSNIE